LRKLTDQEMENISEAAAVAAENYIFSKISKKEVQDMELRVEFHEPTEENGLDVDVEVELYLDELSKAEDNLANEAAEAALEEIDRQIEKLSD
jgi:ribosome-associated translation inhibitor RaiA